MTCSILRITNFINVQIWKSGKSYIAEFVRMNDNDLGFLLRV